MKRKKVFALQDVSIQNIKVVLYDIILHLSSDFFDQSQVFHACYWLFVKGEGPLNKPHPNFSGNCISLFKIATHFKALQWVFQS